MRHAKGVLAIAVLVAAAGCQGGGEWDGLTECPGEEAWDVWIEPDGTTRQVMIADACPPGIEGIVKECLGDGWTVIGCQGNQWCDGVQVSVVVVKKGNITRTLHIDGNGQCIACSDQPPDRSLVMKVEEAVPGGKIVKWLSLQSEKTGEMLGYVAFVDQRGRLFAVNVSRAAKGGGFTVGTPHRVIPARLYIPAEKVPAWAR